MKKYFWVFLVLFASFTALLGPSGSWAWRRRRRQGCNRRDCVLNDWASVVRDHAEGEEFFRGDQSENGTATSENPVRPTTALKECVIGRVLSD